MTPILGRFALFEDLHWERDFARYFAKNGLAALLIDRPIFEFNPKQGLEQIRRYVEDSLKRNRAVLDHVLAQPHSFEKDQIGGFGMSFGAVITCLWAAQDKRLSANFLALGGGNLPEIFMSSQDPLMCQYRNAALAVCDNDHEKLRSSLRGIFTMDPLHAAGHLDPKRTLLILAILDRVVPYRYGKLLREKLGNPETIYLPLGHYFSMLTAPLIKPKAVKFFKEKLTQ